MVLLNKALFTGQESVNAENIVRCDITNWHNSVDKTLKASSGQEGAVACLSLALTDDIRNVYQGCLVTRGALSSPGAR
jgi:hypothetical protein